MPSNTRLRPRTLCAGKPRRERRGFPAKRVRGLDRVFEGITSVLVKQDCSPFDVALDGGVDGVANEQFDSLDFEITGRRIWAPTVLLARHVLAHEFVNPAWGDELILEHLHEV